MHTMKSNSNTWIHSSPDIFTTHSRAGGPEWDSFSVSKKNVDSSSYRYLDMFWKAVHSFNNRMRGF